MSPPSPAGEIGAELVSKAQAGDAGALRTLVARCYPLVRRWALVHTGNPPDADDLTQDVLVQIIRKLDRYGGRSRFTTWLYSVTRNAASDRLRKERRRSRVQDDPRASEALRPDPDPAPDAGADRAEVTGVIAEFFRELPPRQREIFDLADLQGLGSAEIAERLGIEPVSVRANLFKARRTLRTRILERHPDWAQEWAP